MIPKVIKSKNDLKQFIRQDQIARGIKTNTLAQKLKQFIYTDPTWKFQKKLRQVEYYHNKRKNLFQWIYYYYLEYRYKKLSIALGFTIPKNIFGPGLSIPHYGLIIINSRTKIGKNCRIHSGVNIGASGGVPNAPVIGDNVYIGPGAKIYGDIQIPNNTVIAANACVNKSFYEENTILGGIPAKKLKTIDITSILKHI
ncbi:serine O-acetyltransferase [Zobellia sp. 1_MG-2023]|uniref:serine O-acetyltransferase n=1 Tax=Zobellia sp. 1_MG-2023 TaxID=3062626 RepID=UPI0026E2535B|nr:serine acetyltransferase [Zobellia sp. 1_MG-2023]MDO6819740.1 serine acetyltransferase [Zobellia sp. 1_MG-2023]